MASAPCRGLQLVTIEAALAKKEAAVETRLRHADTYKAAPREAAKSSSRASICSPHARPRPLRNPPRRSRGPPARWCLAQYYADLDRLFDGGFRVERSLDPEADALRAPRGAFLVAWDDAGAGAAVGCVALKGVGGGIGEIKRLWVAPEARGRGLARALMAAAEAAARARGMARLRLDTNRALTAAIALYRASGWREVPAFNDEIYGDHWFEKAL